MSSESLLAVPGETMDAVRARRTAIPRQVRAALHRVLATEYAALILRVREGMRGRYIVVGWEDGPSESTMHRAVQSMGALSIDPDACIARGAIQVLLRRSFSARFLAQCATVVGVDAAVLTEATAPAPRSPMDPAWREFEYTTWSAVALLRRQARATDGPLAPPPVRRRRDRQPDPMAIPSGEAALAAELCANGIESEASHV